MEEIGLGVNIGWLGRVEVEHQNGRRDGEEAIAERRDAADLAAGQSVVMGLHGVNNRLRTEAGQSADDYVIAREEAFQTDAPFDLGPATLR